jgi:hypothetical protein
MKGSLTRWLAGFALAGAGLLAAACAGTADDARTTASNTPELPDGFEYFFGSDETPVFAAWSDGARTGVRGLPNMNGGIIKKPVDIPLTEDTEFAFDWVYDHVPALGPETDAAFHDYISIALEFDNGQDLTWMRSAYLDAEQSFHCPLEGWEDRETHFVIESGEEGLGEWSSHVRNVAADYESAIDGPLPSRIVGVWIINVGAFAGHDGDARFANAVITSGGTRTEVFARN